MRTAAYKNAEYVNAVQVGLMFNSTSDTNLTQNDYKTAFTFYLVDIGFIETSDIVLN